MPKHTTEPTLTERTRSYLYEATLGAILSAGEGVNYCTDKVGRAKPKEANDLLAEIIAEAEAVIGLAKVAQKQLAELN